MKHKTKIQFKAFIGWALFYIVTLGLLTLHLQVYKSFVLGYDKDCKDQIKGLEGIDKEWRRPVECRDFGKYHRMLILSISIITVLVIFLAMLISYMVLLGDANKRKLK